jgi:hypothetical protein
MNVVSVWITSYFRPFACSTQSFVSGNRQQGTHCGHTTVTKFNFSFICRQTSCFLSQPATDVIRTEVSGSWCQMSPRHPFRPLQLSTCSSREIQKFICGSKLQRINRRGRSVAAMGSSFTIALSAVRQASRITVVPEKLPHGAYNVSHSPGSQKKDGKLGARVTYKWATEISLPEQNVSNLILKYLYKQKMYCHTFTKSRETIQYC